MELNQPRAGELTVVNSGATDSACREAPAWKRDSHDKSRLAGQGTEKGKWQGLQGIENRSLLPQEPRKALFPKLMERGFL